MNLSKGLVLFCIVTSCTPGQDKAAPDPLEEVKRSFDVQAASFDSLRVVDADSSYSYFFLPKGDSVDIAAKLYGEYRLEKYGIVRGDLNADGVEEALVKYSFTPFQQNNTLSYYKVLRLSGDRMEEVVEVFAGANCEGPKLRAKVIKGGKIEFEALRYAEGDPCCCPSIQEVHQYKLENQKIVKI
jgi:hypothetical protein